MLGSFTQGLPADTRNMYGVLLGVKESAQNLFFFIAPRHVFAYLTVLHSLLQEQGCLHWKAPDQISGEITVRIVLHRTTRAYARFRQHLCKSFELM